MELGIIQLVFLGIVLYKYVRCVLFVLSFALHVAKGVGIAIILLTVFNLIFLLLKHRAVKWQARYEPSQNNVEGIANFREEGI